MLVIHGVYHQHSKRKMMLVQEKFIEEQISEVRDLIDRAEKLRKLPVYQLIYRTKESHWTATECIVHLNKVVKLYNQNISKALEKTNPADGLGPSESPIKLSWLGKISINSLAPENGRIKFKIPTVKSLNPKKDDIRLPAPNIVFDRFRERHEQLIQLMEESEEKNLSRIKIPFILPLVKHNLGDAYAYLIAHAKRHMLQAENMTDNALRNN